MQIKIAVAQTAAILMPKTFQLRSNIGSNGRPYAEVRQMWV